MPPELTFAPRPARHSPVAGFLVWMAVLTAFAITLGVLLSGCSERQRAASQVVAVNVPQPGIDASTTIRARVAARVKALVQAHPATAPWANALAQVCYQVSGAKLPDPLVLRGLFAGVAIFAPDEIDAVLDGVLDVYTRDYPLASSVQAASKNYLTLLGQGIQDGIKAAAVEDAP